MYMKIDHLSVGNQLKTCLCVKLSPVHLWGRKEESLCQTVKEVRYGRSRSSSCFGARTGQRRAPVACYYPSSPAPGLVCGHAWGVLVSVHIGASAQALVSAESTTKVFWRPDVRAGKCVKE